MSEENKPNDECEFTDAQHKHLNAFRHMMLATRELPPEVRSEIGHKFAGSLEEELRMICARAGIAYEIGGTGARVFMVVSPHNPEDPTEARPCVLACVVTGNYSKQDIEMVSQYMEGFMQDGTPTGATIARVKDEERGRADHD